MVFSSVMFVFIFLPCTLISYIILYLICNKLTTQNACRHILNILLLLASILFYTWGEPKGVLLLLLCSVMNYYIGKGLIGSSPRRNKVSLLIGITLNLGILIYYKYISLLLGSGLRELINSFTPDAVYIPEFVDIALPIGISFYIFQSISYLLDIYRREVDASRRYTDFACYLTMFPQLVAGPIVRYQQIATELYCRTITSEKISSGITRFILGLAKKILVADTLGKVADAAFLIPSEELPMYAAWIGIICYSFQIYYDFSGYSDMAIGMGRIFGFTFPENFNYPYISRSIQEFWTRWHISLSTWFKDYLYIPLGGSRNGTFKTYRNLVIVFLLCGLWHGANWTFLAWGGYYGFFLVFERAFPRFLPRLNRLFRHIYVILVVMVGWVLFKADSFTHALSYYKSMLGLFGNELRVNLDWTGHDIDIALILAFIFATPIYRKVGIYFNNNLGGIPVGYQLLCRFIYYILILSVFSIMIMPIFGSSYKAFIYFKF